MNVLLYAGETARTVCETRSWLDQNRNAIKGVSVGPLVIFGAPMQAQPLIKDALKRGARIVDFSSADESGITHIHPSREIDAETAEQISLELSRRYMSVNDYFDLKGFSYYPRQYTRRDFQNDICASDRAVLPFRLSAPIYSS